VSALNSSNQCHLLPETYNGTFESSRTQKKGLHIDCTVLGPRLLVHILFKPSKCKSLNQKELPARKKMPWEQTVDSIQ